MGGKFTNTKYAKTVDSLVQATKGVLNNPYYVFTDKKPTKVTYYRQNKAKTTLDPASGMNYAHIGEQAPIKFDKILDFYLYGIDNIQTTLEVGEFGLETEPIEGQAIVLPNTIEPAMGDFFQIDYLKEKVLFKVNEANSDTLDNGSNVYQISYKLEYIESIDKIEKQVEKTYRCIIGNAGTDFKCIIEDTSYQLIEKLESVLADLVSAYQVFFNAKVQNFVYKMNGYYFYDPYLIEFMIRNKLMSYGEDYIYVHHDTPVARTFGFDYTKTIFYVLENPDELATRAIRNTASAVIISDINSLMTTTIDKFYEMRYNDDNLFNARVEIIPGEILERCKSGELYLDTDPVEKRVYNLMIAYFKKDYDYIQGNLIDLIRQLDYTPNQQFFYLIPINIFIISHFIMHLMEKTTG